VSEQKIENSVTFVFSVCADGLFDVINLLSQSPDGARELIKGFFDSGKPISQFTCVDIDSAAALAKNYRVVFEPSDGLRELLLAVGALKVD
jgi:hypothetical protein